jgi:hypothetical protein
MKGLIATRRNDATTGYRFAVTRWRSGVDSNSRFRLCSAKTANFLDFPFSAGGANHANRSHSYRIRSMVSSSEPKRPLAFAASRNLARMAAAAMAPELIGMTLDI